MDKPEEDTSAKSTWLRSTPFLVPQRDVTSAGLIDEKLARGLARVAINGITGDIFPQIRRFQNALNGGFGGPDNQRRVFARAYRQARARGEPPTFAIFKVSKREPRFLIAVASQAKLTSETTGRDENGVSVQILIGGRDGASAEVKFQTHLALTALSFHAVHRAFWRGLLTTPDEFTTMLGRTCLASHYLKLTHHEQIQTRHVIPAFVPWRGGLLIGRLRPVRCLVHERGKKSEHHFVVQFDARTAYDHRLLDAHVIDFTRRHETALSAFEEMLRCNDCIVDASAPRQRAMHDTLRELALQSTAVAATFIPREHWTV